MTSVIKYCFEEHHFESSPKLQIGTLKYYREHPKIEIADRQEGLTPRYGVHNTSKDIEYDAKTTETITGGGILSGGIKINRGATFVVNAQAQVPNQYIFCATNKDIGCEKTAKSFGYDAWYKINDVDRFMQLATAMMADKIRFSNVLLHKCQISLRHGPVEYSDLPRTLDGSTIDPFLDAVFRKPSHSDLDRSVNFENNHEYRLLWQTFDRAQGLIHGVRKDPILIDFTDEMKEVCSN